MELEENNGAWSLLDAIAFVKDCGIHTHDKSHKRYHLTLHTRKNMSTGYKTNNMGGWCGIGSINLVTISWPRRDKRAKEVKHDT